MQERVRGSCSLAGLFRHFMVRLLRSTACIAELRSIVATMPFFMDNEVTVAIPRIAFLKFLSAGISYMCQQKKEKVTLHFIVSNGRNLSSTTTLREKKTMNDTHRAEKKNNSYSPLPYPRYVFYRNTAARSTCSY